MTIAPGGRAARGASVPGVVSKPSPAVEHGVEDPVELPTPDVRAEPARVAAAERDDAGAITAAQRALHDLHGAAHDAVGGLGRRTGRLRIPVDQHHHVGGAVGQPLRDVQAAAPRADRPVDRAQLVAGHVSADVGVLDARPDVPGQVGAEPVEQFGAWDRGGLRWRQREHEDVGGVGHAGAHDKPAARQGHSRGPRSDTGPTCRRRRRPSAAAGKPARRVSSRMPSTASSVRSTATSAVSATAHTSSRDSSDSKHR